MGFTGSMILAKDSGRTILYDRVVESAPLDL